MKRYSTCLAAVVMLALPSAQAETPAGLCASAACDAARVALQQSLMAEYAKAVSEGSALLTRSAKNPRYAVSGSRRELQALCAAKPGTVPLLVVEAAKAADGAISVQQVYEVRSPATTAKVACDAVSSRMALHLAQAGDSANEALAASVRKLAGLLATEPARLTPAAALARMRKDRGISLLVSAEKSAHPPTIAFLPDLINVAVTGRPGSLPLPGPRPPPSESPGPLLARPEAAPVPAAPAPATQPQVAYDQLISSKPGEQVYVEMDESGQAISYRFDMDPTLFENEPSSSPPAKMPAPPKQ